MTELKKWMEANECKEHEFINSTMADEVKYFYFHTGGEIDSIGQCIKTILNECIYFIDYSNYACYYINPMGEKIKLIDFYVTKKR